MFVHALGETDEAIAQLEGFRDRCQGQCGANLLLALADMHFSRGDTEKAWAWIERAAAQTPDSSAVFRAKIAWLTAQERLDEVCEMSQARRAAQPDDLEALMVGASALSSSGNEAHRRVAAELLEHVTATDPDLLPAQHALAMLAYAQGDLGRAERILRAVVARHADNAQVLNDLAWIIQELHGAAPEALSEALGLAERAVRLEPDNVHYLDTRGVIRTRIPGQLPNARVDFERCVQLTSDVGRKAAALLKLAGVCAELGDTAEARRCVSRARELDERHDVLGSAERDRLAELTARLDAGRLRAQRLPP
jgi:tetratricopeptide (TPR) repeat protein